MNPILMLGSGVVTLALVFYSIAVISEQRKRCISKFILTFITLGICFDISATLLMIIGTNYKLISIHGLIGYSALTAMLVDTTLIWKTRINHQEEISHKLHIYTRFAYGWWVIAYISGSIIGMMHLY